MNSGFAGGRVIAGSCEEQQIAICAVSAKPNISSSRVEANSILTITGTHHDIAIGPLATHEDIGIPAVQMDRGFRRGYVIAGRGEEHDVAICIVATNPEICGSGIEADSVAVVSTAQDDVSVGSAAASHDVSGFA